MLGSQDAGLVCTCSRHSGKSTSAICTVTRAVKQVIEYSTMLVKLYTGLTHQNGGPGHV